MILIRNYAAHLSGGKEYVFRFLFGKKIVDRLLIDQIKLLVCECYYICIALSLRITASWNWGSNF